MNPAMLLSVREKLSHVNVHEPSLEEMIKAKEAQELASPYHWDVNLQQWAPIQKEQMLHYKSECIQLSILTYNVWLENVHKLKRARALLELVKKYSPDILALQEVTGDFLQYLMTQMDWIKAHYWCSDPGDGSTFGPSSYGVLLLAKIPCTKLIIRSLPSNLSRKLVVGSFRVNGCSIAAATAQLESYPENSTLRKQQMQVLEAYTKKYDTGIFMGDTNIAALTEDIYLTSAGFVDVWNSTKSQECGYTCDPEKNAFAQFSPPQRGDRIYIRGATWRSDYIEQIGTTAFEPDELLDYLVYPSAHWGLHCMLITERC